MRIPELLVPASSLEVLKTAVIFGADAVYIGGEVFSLRAKSKNFSLEDMKEGIDFAHAHGVRVYVTSNILAHNQDLEGVREYFKELKVIQPDALIISDPGVFDIAREIIPEIDVHISTQANNTNYGTYNFWYRQGARRVVTARELSMEEIADIRKHIPDDLEIETFVHGAMCIGGEVFSLRAKSKNFSLEDMKEGIDFAHAHGVRVYVTSNILAHNQDLEGVREYFKELKVIQPDALIISDPGVFDIAREIIPEIDVHISTQANNTNYGTYNFWYRQGARRVVTARELSMEEIADIRKHIPDDLEIETFVHGAMCISYSGRCLLSNYFTGRDANQGACTHPCRWKYAVMEESRPGEYLPVYENERGTYIFNSKDLCMIEHIPELIAAGIDSFKIEGRMKTALYVAVVARTYRKAIDDYLKDENLYRQNLPYYREQIAKCTYRQFTTGFFFGKPTHETQIYDSNTYVKEYTYLGIINGQNSQGMYGLEQRNKFSVGETIEVMKPDGRDLPVKVLRICDEEGSDMESCPHPKQKIYVDLGIELSDQDLLRRAEKSDN